MYIPIPFSEKGHKKAKFEFFLKRTRQGQVHGTRAQCCHRTRISTGQKEKMTRCWEPDKRGSKMATTGVRNMESSMGSWWHNARKPKGLPNLQGKSTKQAATGWQYAGGHRTAEQLHQGQVYRLGLADTFQCKTWKPIYFQTHIKASNIQPEKNLCWW